MNSKVEAEIKAKIRAHTTQNTADLRGADLRKAYLSGVNLSGADLREANLKGAYLSGADLRGADLSVADLREANLGVADLSGANLSVVYLSGADLRGAYLSGADLRGADLRGADLTGANLKGAYLKGADLRGADLRGADLSGANLPAYQIPQTGPLEVWKSCWKSSGDNTVLRLQIPADAPRTASLVGRKCRAAKALVLEIVGDRVAYSRHDKRVVYRVGETVSPYDAPYDPDPRIECAPGIHFFLTREEAENY